MGPTAGLGPERQNVACQARPPRAAMGRQLGATTGRGPGFSRWLGRRRA